MNKKALLGLSAIFFLLIGTLACSYSAGVYGGRALHNQGSSVLRADGDPMPPLPWPWLQSLPSEA
jgi:hypothetical protein